METLMTLYNDDAVHVVPGSSRLSGAHKGKDSILALYGGLFEMTNGTLRIELNDVLSDGGDRVVAIHTSTLEKDGENVHAAGGAALFTIVDGKVAEIVDFFQISS